MPEPAPGQPDDLPRGYPFRPEWEVSPTQLRDLMADRGSVVVVDCRTADERARAVIDGSVHIPMRTLLGHPDELDVEPDQRVVVHCHRGIRSLRVTLALRAAGLENVWSLAGGIDAWSQSVDPSVPRY